MFSLSCPKRLFTLSLSVALAMLSMMAGLLYIGDRMSVRHAPLVDAAMEIKLEATTAHLWFEEIMSGDREESIEAVWHHLDQAIWYADAMLNGGENREGRFLPLKDQAMRELITSVEDRLQAFKGIAHRRYDSYRQGGGREMPGGRLDQKFDAVFAQFMSDADKVESQIQGQIRADQIRYRSIGPLLLLISLALSFSLSVFLYRRELGRSRTMHELNEAKQSLERQQAELELEVSQRTKELKAAKEEAERANCEKSRFLANMSHEFRTPLHAISSFVGLALKRDLDEKTGRFMHNIQSSSERLAELLDGLLDLASLDAGNVRLEIGRGDLGSIVEDVLDSAADRIAEKDLVVACDFEDVLIGDFDLKLVAKVVDRLLSNAIQYNPHGGRIEIGIAWAMDGTADKRREALHFVIRDQGPGVPDDELKKVFDKFVQSSKTVSQSGGTGLGLPVSKEIIDLHQGRIWAERPDSGGGLTLAGDSPGAAFHFMIPVEQGAVERNLQPERAVG